MTPAQMGGRRTLSAVRLENEADQDRDDQGVDPDGLCERDGKNHVGLDCASGFRVAAQSLHRLAAQHTDADGRTDGPEAHSNGRRHVLGGGGGELIVRHCFLRTGDSCGRQEERACEHCGHPAATGDLACHIRVSSLTSPARRGRAASHTVIDQ